MQLTREQIRARLATVPTDELRAILASTDGEYTAETYEVALDELAKRGEAESMSEPEVDEEDRSGPTVLDGSRDSVVVPLSESLLGEATPPFALLPHENVISTLRGNTIVLTTHRIRSYEESVGQSNLTSIMLDQIASTSVVSLSKPWLLVVGFLMLVGSLALADRSGNTWIAGVVVALAFVAAYFITRRYVLSVASSAATITVDVLGVSESEVRDMIDRIEAAQDSRYQIVRSSPMG